jgi:hypothetical protein
MKQKDKKKSGKSDKKKRWFLFRQIKRNVALVEDSIAAALNTRWSLFHFYCHLS